MSEAVVRSMILEFLEFAKKACLLMKTYSDPKSCPKHDPRIPGIREKSLFVTAVCDVAFYAFNRLGIGGKNLSSLHCEFEIPPSRESTTGRLARACG